MSPARFACGGARDRAEGIPMSESSEPFVSVVTPFYNTAEYIAQCIQSVLAQSYGNFEYILVDNQSTDGSAEIAKSFAARDRRIRLLRSPRFLSAEQNYSFALQQIDPAARFCKMVLADDWIYPSCLKEMVALAAAHPSVHLVSSYGLWEDYVGCGGLHASRKVLSGRETCRLHLLDKLFLFGTPSTVLYSADAIRKKTPFFEDGHLHEDTEIAFRILRDTDFGFVHQVLSFTRVQADSRQGRARAYRPRQLDRLIIVKKYGRDYLDEQEYRACLESAVSDYYNGLATEWLLDRFRKTDSGFWAYQNKGLDTIGERVDRELLGKHVAKVLLHGMFNASRAAPYVWQKVTKRSRRPPPPAPVQTPSVAAPEVPDPWPDFERIPESKRMQSAPNHKPPAAVD
jgi:glycosyltransferase involved in cell wall biosynthesis